MDGLCECGCGGETKIATRNSKQHGWIKGKHLRFIYGHRQRIETKHWTGGIVKGGYGYIDIRIRNMEHPRIHNGYIPEHILVAEKALGKLLPEKAIVHHINEIRDDNINENLVICEDRAYHNLLHRRMRAYRATGDVRSIKCKYCKVWGLPIFCGGDMKFHDRDRESYHGKCKSDRQTIYYHKKKRANGHRFVSYYGDV